MSSTHSFSDLSPQSSTPFLSLNHTRRSLTDTLFFHIDQVGFYACLNTERAAEAGTRKGKQSAQTAVDSVSSIALAAQQTIYDHTLQACYTTLLYATSNSFTITAARDPP